MKKIEKVFPNSVLRAEVLEFLDRFPKNNVYTVKLGKINIGTIWESYHICISYDDNNTIVTSDYYFNSRNCLDINGDEDERKKCDTLESAKEFILNTIPKECWDYVTVTKRIVNE